MTDDSDISAIVDVSDAQLLRRAAVDCAQALRLYAIASNRSTDGAIRFLNTLRQQFDQARIDHREILRRRSEAS